MSKSKTAKARKETLYGNKSYFDLVAEADKSISDRRAIPIGRGGKEKIVRRFHLLGEDVATLKEQHEAGDKFPSPYNQTCYGYLLTVLAKNALSTQENPKHITFAKLVQEFKELTSDKETKDEAGETFWARFKSKESRNEKTGLDFDDRILQNLLVLQRVSGKTPYGLRIDQVAKAVLGVKGAAIDLCKGRGDEINVCLNIDPQNFREFTCNPDHLPVGYKAIERDGKHYVKVAQPVNELKRQPKTEEEKAAALAAKAEAKAAKKAEKAAAKAAKPRKVKVAAKSADLVPIDQAIGKPKKARKPRKAKVAVEAPVEPAETTQVVEPASAHSSQKNAEKPAEPVVA